jgi:hypothetical protein
VGASGRGAEKKLHGTLRSRRFELSKRGTKAETTFSLKAARLVIIELPAPEALPDSTLCNRDEVKPISV